VANGSPTPTYSFVSGTLPPGISVSPTGVISGVPSRQGSYTFTVQANNSAGSAMTVVTLVVGAPRPLATFVEQTTGGIGTVVVIRGYNLSNATGVSFGGVSALRFTVDNANQITAIVGAGNSGEIIVTTPEGTSSAPQGFIYTPPQVPVINSINPALVLSGDEDYSIVLRGQNFSQYATYLVQPETGTNASFSVPLPVVIESVVSGEARLRLPLASRTLGMKRLVIRIGDNVVSSTFAVVAGAKPQILSQTVPSTTATSRAFTTELIGTGFFRRGFASITVNGSPANASVLDSNRARVEIPASLNILGSRVAILLTNYDGQFTETVVNVVSRVAPLISTVLSRVEGGRIRMIVRGSGFWGVQSVLVQNRTVLLVRTSPAELEIELPNDFPLPRLTEESWVLMVENPDGQKYGYRLANSLFYPTSATLSSSISPKNTAETNSTLQYLSMSNNEALGQLLLSPNPASELLTIATPAFSGQGRWQMLNARGEEVMSEAVAGGEHTQVDVRSLPSGVYFVRVVAPGVRAVVRVAVVH
jgi:Secretion system C-terminal sorting domain